MVRMYYPESITKVQVTKSPEEVAKGLEMVTKLMKYTNIVGTAEATAFAKYLKADMTQFYDLVTNAAGASKMFNTLAPAMTKTSPTGPAAAGSQSIDEIIKELSEIVQVARDLYCPLNLATEALTQYLVAQRRGWGAEASPSIIRVWEN
jgi:3-hydroxyisobutyrate dehydrogenase